MNITLSKGKIIPMRPTSDRTADLLARSQILLFRHGEEAAGRRRNLIRAMQGECFAAARLAMTGMPESAACARASIDEGNR